MNDNVEWVEIEEPNKNVKMFTNLITGECSWDEPMNVPIIRASQSGTSQWWELFDEKTNKFYYYNAKSQQTVWRKPKGNHVVVVPLAKLQTLKQKDKQKQDASTQTINEINLVTRGTQTKNHLIGSLNLKQFLLEEAKSIQDNNNQWSYYYYYNDDDLDDYDDDDDDGDDSEYSGDADDESENELFDYVSSSSSSEDQGEAELKVKDFVDGKLNDHKEQLQNQQVQSHNQNQNQVIKHEIRTSILPTTTIPKQRPLLLPHAHSHHTHQQTKEQTIKENHELESFAKDNIVRHVKSGVASMIIQRKISLKAMLTWTKRNIKAPMIATIPSQYKNDCIQLFKMIRMFMGDLQPQIKSNKIEKTKNEIAFHIIKRGVDIQVLRDEILVQLARQTTENPNSESLSLGLELMALCLWYFKPSNKLHGHLRAHLNAFKHPQAKLSVKKLDQMNTISHCRSPHDLDEINLIMKCVRLNHCGVFGEPLTNTISYGHLIPFPVIILTELILKIDKTECEGVFRLVGDIESVLRLKLKFDSFITSSSNQSSQSLQLLSEEIMKESFDVHVLCCCLKLFFRELQQPIIPFDVYNDAIEHCNDQSMVCQLVMSLPAINRLTLGYLVRFLQVFSSQEYVEWTKMDVNNLAVVWAPNILRTNQSQIDTQMIYEFTRKEMLFMKLLIEHLDTEFCAGIN